jgi:hypothetical protein
MRREYIGIAARLNEVSECRSHTLRLGSETSRSCPIIAPMTLCRVCIEPTEDARGLLVDDRHARPALTLVEVERLLNWEGSVPGHMVIRLQERCEIDRQCIFHCVRKREMLIDVIGYRDVVLI